MSYEVLIFSHSVTGRLQYIVEFLSQYYGFQFKLISNEERYLNSKRESCKINYSYHRIDPDEIFIHTHALLFETSVRPVKIECFEKNGYKAFFKEEGDFGFDIFAAVFYLITRYEEYLPHQKDSHGRYAHENSIAFQEGFLHLPLINIWLEDFRKLLAGRNSKFKIQNSKFSFLPTYDIDMAWSFLHKGFKRNAGAVLLLFLKAKFRKIAYRIKVLRRKKQDPFDAYEWLDRLHKQHQLKPVYFFLVAKGKGKYDKNIDVDKAAFQVLIKDIASKYEIGLHPSWVSGDDPEWLVDEKHTLEKISDRQILSSRQHYIRFHLPETYQQLINIGITNDYSMGYGSSNGFRASIANSFYWYDLKNEKKTKLLLHPFCFMDANAFYEQNLTPETVKQELLHYYNAVKSVNGKLITIWHNSFLGTDANFFGWKEAFEEFVSMIEIDNREM